MIIQPHWAKAKILFCNMFRFLDWRVGHTSLQGGRLLTILGQCPWKEGGHHAWLAAGQLSHITTEQGLGLA